MNDEGLPLLVDPVWLVQRLQDPQLLVVDTRPSDEYGTEHIPGAVSWDTFLKYHWADTSSKGLELFIGLMARTIGGAGVGPDTRVVVYEMTSGYRAARALWLLRWLGHEQSTLLDGGLDAWKASGSATTATPRAAEPAVFRAVPIRAEVADVSDVLRLMRDPAGLVLDVRSPDEFTGKHRRAIRGGHVPSAKLLDWVNNVDESGRYKPLEELEHLYADAGVLPDREIVTYCHGGYRAAHSWIALKLLGYPRVRAYLGSWQEWGDRLDLPIAV